MSAQIWNSLKLMLLLQMEFTLHFYKSIFFRRFSNLNKRIDVMYLFTLRHGWGVQPFSCYTPPTTQMFFLNLIHRHKQVIHFPNSCWALLWWSFSQESSLLANLSNMSKYISHFYWCWRELTFFLVLQEYEAEARKTTCQIDRISDIILICKIHSIHLLQYLI